ncbi:hypothetical protein [Microbulbifer agarilyticus]
MLPTVPSASTPTSHALLAWGNSGNGRSILADGRYRSLLDKFQLRSAEQSNDGLIAQELIKAVNSLRAQASPLNSMLKPGSPTRRLLVAGHFEIEYELNSYYCPLQTDIQIIDIRIKKGELTNRQRAGLWDAKLTTRGQWQRAASPKLRITETVKQKGTEDSPILIGINGRCKNLDDAVNTLPDHMARGDKLNLERLKPSYQLFYVPVNAGESRGWLPVKSLGKKNREEQHKAALTLADQIYSAHNRGLHVEWTAHDSGSFVLTKAMDILIKKNIDLQQRQRIYLSDHTSSEYEADLCRRALNMNVNGDKWANSRPGIRQIIGGSQFGYAKISSKYLVLTHATPTEEKWGALAEFGLDTLGTAKSWKGALAAGVAASSGVSFAVGALVLSTFGETLLSSLPSLNKNYYKGLNNQVKFAINKLGSNGT